MTLKKCFTNVQMILTNVLIDSLIVFVLLTLSIWHHEGHPTSECTVTVYFLQVGAAG